MIPVSAEKMAEIDAKARNEYGVKQEDLMERAGISVAEAILEDFSPEKSKDIFIICGKGNNGGDGFVSARYLFNRLGSKVKLYFPGKENIRDGAALENLKKVQATAMTLNELPKVLEDLSADATDTIVIDALLGTGYKGAMRELYAEIAEKVNFSRARVYSVDIPSGLNATTGEVLGNCFKAFRTITFGLPKIGFYKARGPEFCGRIDVADIGFPRKLLKEFM